METNNFSNAINNQPICNFFERIFNRWTKWELYQEDKSYYKVTYSSVIMGNYEIDRVKILVDIYSKTNKFTGLKKYKKIIKS